MWKLSLIRQWNMHASSLRQILGRWGTACSAALAGGCLAHRILTEPILFQVSFEFKFVLSLDLCKPRLEIPVISTVKPIVRERSRFLVIPLPIIFVRKWMQLSRSEFELFLPISTLRNTNRYTTLTPNKYYK